MSRGHSTSVQTLSYLIMTVLNLSKVDPSAYDVEEIFEDCETGNDILATLDALVQETV